MTSVFLVYVVERFRWGCPVVQDWDFMSTTFSFPLLRGRGTPPFIGAKVLAVTCVKASPTVKHVCGFAVDAFLGIPMDLWSAGLISESCFSKLL